MKETKIKKEIQYVCDNCSKKFNTQFIAFDMIDDLQMRILEMNPHSVNNHYTYGRKHLDFCSTDCALKFLNSEMKLFIKEIVVTKSKRK